MGKRIAPLFIVIFCCATCSGGFVYVGDGTLIDNGLKDGGNRYILDLGELPLTKRGVYSYRIGKLPTYDNLIGSVRFVIGIEIRTTPRETDRLTNRTINPLVSIEFGAIGDTPRVKHRSFLNAWEWAVSPKNVAGFTGEATTFVYLLGENSTYFSPTKDDKYQLKIEIEKPDESGIGYSAHIIAKSGGWQ